ncbi:MULTISPECIES: hypothetical protein [unclassified Streptomyces]|uniref:hypothetical protein n=1 Tax=Streptomyces TaxID=1883 RepID=UPI0015C461C8|nr:MULTISPECIES: hypothetical protein [unclassified Streptomyces]MBK0373613.1 hypothetical protein [Streptomyces sp. RB110-1]MBK0390019.1 hypothetical protein [Streptomyces sp. RB110-2]QLG31084.1 hypothetical protein HXS80_04825 [Streptomyces sp. CB04723]
MDPYDSQTPHDGERHPAPTGTPIYDRLVAEWQAAGGDHPFAEPTPTPVLRRVVGFVPAARTPEPAPGT